MSNPELRDKLQQLQHELGQAKPADEHTQARMQHLQRQVQGVLDSPEPTPAHLRSLREQLHEAIEEFEVSHPALTWAISDALDTLSLMGI